MVEVRRFAKRFNIESRLHHYPGIYAIDSEVYNGTTYCISDGKFGILRGDGIVYCPIEETVELANRMIPEVRDEILEIVESMRILK